MTAPDCPYCGHGELIVTTVWAAIREHLDDRTRLATMAMPVSTCLRCNLSVVGIPDDEAWSPCFAMRPVDVISGVV